MFFSTRTRGFIVGLARRSVLLQRAKTSRKGSKTILPPAATPSINDDLSRMPDLIDDDTIDSFLALSRAELLAPPAPSGPAKPRKRKPTSAVAGASPVPALRTILDVFRYAVTRFAQADVELAFGQSTTDATEEAHLLLLLHLSLPLGPTDAFLQQYGRARLSQKEADELAALIDRRCGVEPQQNVESGAAPSTGAKDPAAKHAASRRVPVAYLMRACYQQGEKLFVDERALIPRSFIGELLNPASRHCLFDPHAGANAESELGSKEGSKGGSVGRGKLLLPLQGVTRVLDLCCGSGALAILAHRLLTTRSSRSSNSGGGSGKEVEDQACSGEVTVDCVDISADALAVCAENVRLRGLQGNLRLIQSDCFDSLGAPSSFSSSFSSSSTSISSGSSGSSVIGSTASGKYDLILCNPPYVDSAAMPLLPQEYRAEPALALDGGPGGMSVVTRVLAGAAARMHDGAWLVLEVGAARAGVRALLRAVWAGREGREGKEGREGREGVVWVDTANSRGEVVVLSRAALVDVAKHLKKE